MISLTYFNSPMLQNEKKIKRTAKHVQHGILVNLMDCKTTNRQIKQDWAKYINTLKTYEYFSRKDI